MRNICPTLIAAFSSYPLCSCVPQPLWPLCSEIQTCLLSSANFFTNSAGRGSCLCRREFFEREQEIRDTVPREENRLNYPPSSPTLTRLPPQLEAQLVLLGLFSQVFFRLHRKKQSSLIKVSLRFYVSFFTESYKTNKTHSAQSKSNQSYSVVKHGIDRKKIWTPCPGRMNAKNRVIFWLCLSYL